MKIGAYQFAVTGDTKCNFEIVKKAVLQASNEKVKLLVFPECALTALFDRSGEVLKELERNAEGLLTYDLVHTKDTSGEQGRREISDWLVMR